MQINAKSYFTHSKFEHPRCDHAPAAKITDRLRAVVYVTKLRGHLPARSVLCATKRQVSLLTETDLGLNGFVLA